MALHVPFLGILTAPLLLTLWSAPRPLRRSPWPALIAIALFGRAAVSIALANIHAPAQWDYGSFWLYGQVAAAHGNFYDPAVLGRFPLPFTPRADFLAAVSNVGFPYPPPTMLLFLPLGHIENLSIGLSFWYALQGIALVAGAWVLARALLPKDGWPAFALVLALALALPATHDNVANAQTSFLALFVVALAFAGRTTPLGAVWQLFAVWIKPYAIALFLVDVIRAQWRRLGVAAVAAVASLVVAAALFGPQTVVTYVRSNPASREPTFAFYEIVNQSLLAGVLRTQQPPPAHVSLLDEPVYLLLALVAVGVSAALFGRARRTEDLPFAIALLVGLLVYPATLASYGVVLVVPLFILWSRYERLPGGAPAIVVLTLLVTVAQGPLKFGLGANLVTWLYCVVALGMEIPRKRSIVASRDADLVGRDVGEVGPLLGTPISESN